MKFYNIFFAAVVCLLWSGCNIINPPETTPTYIHIDSFKFSNPKPGITGSASHVINSVWVSYNGVVVGVYDLPATIPIIASGSSFMAIGPGITKNGMNSFEAVYPFYYYDTSTLVAQPGKVINYTPQTRYIDNGIGFPLMENFELGTSFETVSGEPLIRTSAADSIFEGHGSGVIRLTHAGDTSFVLSTDSAIAIPAGNSYCEFNYKGNLNLKIGMAARIPGLVQTVTIAGFNPTNTWQKIYVSLGDLVQTYYGGVYTLFFTAGLPAGQTSGYVLLDNIKIVDRGN